MIPAEFDLSTYDYILPEELIAQTPLNPRDASRLLVVDRKNQSWEHRTFRDLPDYLDAQDLMVFNNTKVLKARLLGFRLRQENEKWVRGGKVEFVMLEEKAPRVWEGLFHASAKYLPGLKFEIPYGEGKTLLGTLVKGSADSPTGSVIAEFSEDPVASGAGEIPLPHYIDRATTPEDESRYQTVYAKVSGSAAAPTAGLHFTENVMNQLSQKGVTQAYLTLHVGVGTFRPVKTQDVRQHVMHEERYEVSQNVAKQVTEWKKNSGRVLAVGTTSVRTLESAWDLNGSLKPGFGRTALFIKPGEFQFQVVDRMLTNFHLPKSTLLMLICAFGGTELILAAYAEAVKQKYRFFSYGDAMLVI